jgi:hypothetical protein
MKPLLCIVVVLLGSALPACNSLVNVPFSSLKTGPTATFAINEPRASGTVLTGVTLTMAPGTATLALAGGADGLVNGEIQYNVAEWKPTLAMSDGMIRIEQHLADHMISSSPEGAINQWNLQLGDRLKDVHVACPAGNFTLSFADTLPDGASITVDIGAGNLRLAVPAGVAARVAIHRGPSSVATEGAWTKSGATYATSGAGPTWTIQVDMGVGNLTLVSS